MCYWSISNLILNFLNIYDCFWCSRGICYAMKDLICRFPTIFVWQSVMKKTYNCLNWPIITATSNLWSNLEDIKFCSGFPTTKSGLGVVDVFLLHKHSGRNGMRQRVSKSSGLKSTSKVVYLSNKMLHTAEILVWLHFAKFLAEILTGELWEVKIGASQCCRDMVYLNTHKRPTS